MVKEFDKIVVHWTAGGHKANSVYIAAYHFLVEGDGNIVKGSHSVWNNSVTNMNKINRRTGNYAHHTGGGNTGAIGVALCGMYGYISPYKVGKYPLKKAQCEAAFALLAKLCKDYKIDDKNVITHWEFAKAHPSSTSAGKIDITYLPPYPDVASNQVGGFIRNRVRGILGVPLPTTNQSDGVMTGGAAPIAEETGGSSGGVTEEPKEPPVKYESSKKLLSFLTTINNTLERIPLRVINAFNNIVGSGENVTQSKIDGICAWLSYKVNVQVEKIRQKAITKLHEQYMSNTNSPMFRAARAIADFTTDPLGALGSFAGSIFAPVKIVFEWVKVLMKEIPRLASNLANIVSSLPPDPPNPNINYDKFRLKVNSIGMKEIIKGPAGFKDPEDMFPKPADPFKRDPFILFGDDSADLMSKYTMYKLKPGDFETMNTAIQQEAKSDLLDKLGIETFSTSSTINEINQAFHEGTTSD